MPKPAWWPQASDGTNAVVVVDFKNGAYWYFDGANYNSVTAAAALNLPARVTPGTGAKWAAAGTDAAIAFQGALLTALLTQWPVSVTCQFDFTPGGSHGTNFWLFSYSHDPTGLDDMELDLQFDMFNSGSPFTVVESSVYDATGGTNPIGTSVSNLTSPAVLASSYQGTSSVHAYMNGGTLLTKTGTAMHNPPSPAPTVAFAGAWDGNPPGTLGNDVTIENIVMFPLLSDAALLSVSTPNWWAGAPPPTPPGPVNPTWVPAVPVVSRVMFGAP